MNFFKHIRILQILIVLFAPAVFAQPDTNLEALLCLVSSRISLKIQDSFVDDEITFGFCEASSDEPGKLVKIVSNPRESSKNAESHIRVLNQQQANEIKAMFESTLVFDLRDNKNGVDGAQWHIQTSYFQGFEISIWNPNLDAEERGYQQLIKFRDHLLSLFE